MTGGVTVNGTKESNGSTTSIMGEDPIAGLLWAANELPKWGMHLKAGEFVVSGTVCIPLAGKVPATVPRVAFTGMSALSATFVE